MSADSVVAQELQALGILVDFNMVSYAIASASAKDLYSWSCLEIGMAIICVISKFIVNGPRCTSMS